MFQLSVSTLQSSTAYSNESSRRAVAFFDTLDHGQGAWFEGIKRRWRRERRRRKVGRAYDMALEVARLVPQGSRVLDVGCGSGFIAHHLSAMLGTKAIGIDLDVTAEAAIDYRQFNGSRFPVADAAVDAALLCYVLHHAQDLGAIMQELRRVLSAGGLTVIYEDVPAVWWDRFVCWTHDLKWRRRTGRCKFRNAAEWRAEFASAGFEVLKERELSRWRNLAHPVRRRLYLLKPINTGMGQGSILTTSPL